MKINKIENRISFYLLTFGMFLLNYKSINILSLLFGILLSFIIILLFEKINIFNNKIFKFIIFIISSFFITFYLTKISYYISYNIVYIS